MGLLRAGRRACRRTAIDRRATLARPSLANVFIVPCPQPAREWAILCCFDALQHVATYTHVLIFCY